MLRILLIAVFSMIAALCSADEWSVGRMRGEVEHRVGLSWKPVEAGMLIEDRAHVRTGADGRVDLQRGAELVSLGANTEIEIRDGGAELMTTIIQESGVLTADVERRNVQHFSVQTPFLAAVVKGTKFTVTVDENGSHVEVERGVVQVQDGDNELVVDIRPGQDAIVTADTPLHVEGGGDAPVFTFDGDLVAAPAESSGQSSANTGNGQNASDSSNTTPSDHGNGNGNNGSGNGGSNGGGNSGNGNGGGNGNGNSGGSSGNGNGGGNGNSGNGNGNGGGNGNSGSNGGGNSGNGNGNSGNGNGNSGNGGGNSNSGNGTGGGNSGNGNGNGGGNGNSGNGNGNSGSGNGNSGNGKGHDKD